MPISYGSGPMPGPAGETSTADGQDMSAPVDMSQACQQAADAALGHAQAEAGKVAMNVSTPTE